MGESQKEREREREYSDLDYLVVSLIRAFEIIQVYTCARAHIYGQRTRNFQSSKILS